MNNYSSAVNRDSNQIGRRVKYNPPINRGESMLTEEIRKNLALNVHNLMKELGMSAMDVERQSGGNISNRTIGHILREERSVGIDGLAALGRAFKIQPSLLLTKLSENDLEHIRLLESLSEKEKDEVSQYANFLIQKRNPPSE